MEVDTTKCNKRVLDQAHTVASWHGHVHRCRTLIGPRSDGHRRGALAGRGWVEGEWKVREG